MRNWISFRSGYARLPVAGLLLLIAGHAGGAGDPADVGEQAPMYDVEVVIFRNLSPQAGGEHWPVRAPEEIRQYGDGFDTRPVGAGIEELAREAWTLDDIAAALQRSGGYEVLVHAAWRQAGLDRSLARPWQVPDGIQRAGYELHGTIRLVRERYLHLDLDLELTRPQAEVVPGPGMALPDTVYALRETRRVRRGDLQYFDHPLFGVIARVVSYAAPEPAGPPQSGEAVREDSGPAEVGDVPVAPDTEGAPDNSPDTPGSP